MSQPAPNHQPRLYQASIRDVCFGRDVTVVEPANLYECTIGDEAFIGPFCEVQRGVTIGARTRLQSHSFVCEQVSIGADCFIAHGVMFINDRFAGGGPSRDPAEWEGTVIEDGVSIGSNATILPVRIATGCVIGAGAVVSRDLLRRGIYVGNPARLLRPLLPDAQGAHSGHFLPPDNRAACPLLAVDLAGPSEEKHDA